MTGPPGADGPQPDAEPVRVCFVCLGNICRSPTAEAVMARLVRDAGLDGRIEVDSAGTGGWHVGDPPDDRARAEARRRGIEMSSRARQLHVGDLAFFDLVVAMDRRNLADVHDLALEPAHRDKVVLLRTFDPATADEAADTDALDVPDPYYGGPDGFARVFDLVEAACRGLLAHLEEQHLGTDADPAVSDPNASDPDDADPDDADPDEAGGPATR
ncbi:MAG: low molecular weight protein-tyrosine-phosphatase [Acidimicrobiales bacterium]